LTSSVADHGGEIDAFGDQAGEAVQVSPVAEFELPDQVRRDIALQH